MTQTCGGGENEDVDASLSFLEPLTTAGTHAGAACHGPQDPPTLQIAPDIMDPVFLSCTVRVPAKIEAFFKRTPKIDFIYDFDDTDCMAIETAASNARPYLIYVDFFEKFPFAADIEPELVFILGRQKYKAAQKAAQKKAYMACVDSGIAYEGADLYKSMKRRYLEYQVDTGRNFVFIEDTETLHRQIKNVVTVLNRKERYVPKVKTFGEEQKNAFLMSVLRNIPGVSENVARSIHRKYPTFKALRGDLINNREALVNLVVCDSTGQNTRPLGERIFKRLSVSFLSDKKNTRI